MADTRPDMSKILSNVEQEIQGERGSVSEFAPPAAVERFAPAKYRNSDSLIIIHQDFKKAIADLEARLKAFVEDLKRATG